MNRRERKPIAMEELLAELARRSGDSALVQAHAAAEVARAVGSLLERRILEVHAEGDAIRIEAIDAPSARELERHAAEILGRLRSRLGSIAPKRLVIGVSRRSPPEARPTVPGRAEARRDLPLTRRALDGMTDDDARSRLERLVGLGRSGNGPRGSGTPDDGPSS